MSTKVGLVLCRVIELRNWDFIGFRAQGFNLNIGNECILSPDMFQALLHIRTGMAECLCIVVHFVRYLGFPLF